MKKLILIAFTTLFLTSCLGTKKVTESTQKVTENKQTEVKKDSVVKTEVNKPINDKIVINVPETDNKEVMQMFNRLLRQINTSKSSGDNSYRIYYDEQLKQLKADIKIAQTENKETTQKEEKKSEESRTEYVEDRIFKKIKLIPWWVYLIVVLVFWPQIVSRVMMIYNPIKGFIKK